jgi:asparagine synthase (glutamine-hydrolysing)
MPGIVGLITRNPDQKEAESTLSQMLRCMAHEPCLSHGTYCLPELGFYLGWVAHRGSYADCNPIVEQRRGAVLIFSGEHFVHSNGGAKSDHSAATLLSQYDEDAEQFVRELNGWFSGVLVDRRRKSLLLFNDRFGVHRVYLHEGRDSFAFASEAKAILSVRPETRALDPAALGQFLGFGSVFDGRTLFSGISLLPGGSAWTIHGPTSITKGQYFHPRQWTEQSTLDAATFYSALRQTVSKTLPSYFRSEAPVGISLTAGLDTRIVMAGMPADATPLPTYTYAGVYRECLDVRIAREVSRTCGVPHSSLALGPDFFKNFSTHAEQTIWLTDGCLSLGASHEVYFSKLARQLSPVRLTGNYGSEVLRSHSTFKYLPATHTLFDSEVVRRMAEARERFAEIRDDHPVTFSAFKEVPWHLFGMWAMAQSQFVLRSPFMDNEFVALLYRAPANTRETKETSRRLIADMNPRLATIPTDMGHLGPSTLSATARRLYRYAQFKAEWYYGMGMPQWFARFEPALPLGLVEPFFLGSHKITHFRQWFKNQLSDFVQGMLSDPATKTRPYLDASGFRALVAAHDNRRRNVLNEIDKVVTLELVHRLLLERNYGK